MPSAIARAYSTMDHRFQPRPGRRTGGQEGSGEPCSRDQEPGTRRLPLPLRRPAGGSRGGSALVDILGVKLGGLIGAFIWKGVYLYELGYDLNRAHVLADWTIDLFSRPDTSKLFEGSERPDTDT